MPLAVVAIQIAASFCMKTPTSTSDVVEEKACAWRSAPVQSYTLTVPVRRVQLPSSVSLSRCLPPWYSSSKNGLSTVNRPAAPAPETSSRLDAEKPPLRSISMAVTPVAAFERFSESAVPEEKSAFRTILPPPAKLCATSSCRAKNAPAPRSSVAPSRMVRFCTPEIAPSTARLPPLSVMSSNPDSAPMTALPVPVTVSVSVPAPPSFAVPETLNSPPTVILSLPAPRSTLPDDFTDAPLSTVNSAAPASLRNTVPAPLIETPLSSETRAAEELAELRIVMNSRSCPDDVREIAPATLMDTSPPALARIPRVPPVTAPPIRAVARPVPAEMSRPAPRLEETEPLTTTDTAPVPWDATRRPRSAPLTMPSILAVAPPLPAETSTPKPNLETTEPRTTTDAPPLPREVARIPPAAPATAPPRFATASPLPPSIMIAVPVLPVTSPVVLTLAPPLPSAVATIPCRIPLTSTAETWTPSPAAPSMATIPSASATRPVMPPMTLPVTTMLTPPPPALRAWIACPAAAIRLPVADCVSVTPPSPRCESASPWRVPASASTMPTLLRVTSSASLRALSVCVSQIRSEQVNTPLPALVQAPFAISCRSQNEPPYSCLLKASGKAGTASWTYAPKFTSPPCFPPVIAGMSFRLPVQTRSLPSLSTMSEMFLSKSASKIQVPGCSLYPPIRSARLNTGLLSLSRPVAPSAVFSVPSMSSRVMLFRQPKLSRIAIAPGLISRKPAPLKLLASRICTTAPLSIRTRRSSWPLSTP